MVFQENYQVSTIAVVFFSDVTDVLFDSLQFSEQFAQLPSFGFNLLK